VGLSLWPFKIQAMEHTDDILELFIRRGAVAYDGEGVSQLQHAWQCGRLAAQAHAGAELQLACWLHDLGHLSSIFAGTPTLRGIDDQHELTAARLIEPMFGPAVADPVALHVAAKRYLVATRPRYAQILSMDSRRSLLLQGGPMSPLEASNFISHPLSGDALRLRAWDECAKLTEWVPSSVESALTELASLMDEVRSQVT
jgi:predicted HD phosphohydrolase